MNLADQVAEHVKRLEDDVYAAAKRFEEETGLVVSYVSFEHRSYIGQILRASASVNLSTNN